MPESHGAGPRLDSVEIKMTFSAAQAAAAAEALAPGDGGIRRHVHFCEAPPRGRGPGTPALLDGGVILRLRADAGHGRGDGDATVKLRPCRRARLSRRWLRFREEDGDTLRLEEDWSAGNAGHAENRVLAASLTSDCGRPAVDAVTSGANPLRTVFSRRQRAFLAECADVRVDFRTLRVLGPVRAVRWHGVRLNHHELTLERWSFAASAAESAGPGPGEEPLDWLEISERVAPDGAEVVQASLQALVRGLGLEPDLKQETKTRRVLETLLRARPAT
ncbi:hypothetical protein [Streptomyces niger]|uniref:hypothetical protein n=1 Tax=Streptomyces niger TaxID=66373 RepID=UPI00069B4765|nr:hypothetical protein [Streptomyces niger]